MVTLSVSASFLGTALAATGFIWVRYSLVITPVNYSLAAVRPFGYLLEAAWVTDLSTYVVGQLLRRGHGSRAISAYCSVGYSSALHIFAHDHVLPRVCTDIKMTSRPPHPHQLRQPPSRQYVDICDSFAPNVVVCVSASLSWGETRLTMQGMLDRTGQRWNFHRRI